MCIIFFLCNAFKLLPANGAHVYQSHFIFIQSTKYVKRKRQQCFIKCKKKKNKNEVKKKYE